MTTRRTPGAPETPAVAAEVPCLCTMSSKPHCLRTADWNGRRRVLPSMCSRALSPAQVRRRRGPLYSTAVGKWRRNERQLAPFTGILDALRPERGWRFESV